MTHAPPNDFQDALATTRRAQDDAADPQGSAWVSANAGTGKTHVLTNRVLRLLLAGTKPECILCLTFTKAAAAEMSQRIFRKLAAWVTATDDKLAAELKELTGRLATRAELALGRQLFARAIETPGGLKVQTIHAFCERLLQRFPLEAGVPPGFTILDEETAHALMREAIDEVLAETGRHPSSPLARAIEVAARYAIDDRFDLLLKQALGKPDWLRDVERASELMGTSDQWAGVDAFYRRSLGLRNAITAASIEAELARVLSPDALKRAHEVLAAGSKTDAKMAMHIADALAAANDASRIAALLCFFYTSDGDERKSLVTKPTAARAPDVAEVLQQAQGRFASLDTERLKLALIDATVALARIADAVHTACHRSKIQRAALDYDDLIHQTASLLAESSNAEWVLFKLDEGLDHILVDEAQDTSPAQWRIVERLAQEFFAGAGAREDKPRTLFAVGDEKQSIYGFQGAAPHMFAGMGAHFEGAANSARQMWRRIALSLSFRTVAPVLDAVDRVFEDAQRVPGVTASGAYVRHVAHRRGHAGIVEIWEPELPAEKVETDAWAPLDEPPIASPVARLADRIANRIADWLEHGERLESTGRPIEPGDILILVRRRAPFAPAMVAALKARGIPVAGADRIRLRNQIAVEDLVALGDVLVLPEDDLALACVLKSPLIGLDDADLLRFAPQRKGSLWSALLAAAASDPRLAEAAERLKRWRRRADYMPPYELFAELLDREGGRARLLTRIGPEAADAIDEFLDLAVRYDDGEAPSLQGFLHWLRGSDRQIKRDMDHGRNEVRVMTVHGAKGLEAPIVFLPDTCSARSGEQPGGLLAMPGISRPVGMGGVPLVWPVKGTSKLAEVTEARSVAKAAEAEERSRLLYVAMTRARDRLYIAGYQTRATRDAGCWYDQICDGLGDAVDKITDANGQGVKRVQCPQSVAPEAAKEVASGGPLPEPPPAWARRAAPREAGLAIPLAPSRLLPLESDDAGEPLEPPRDPLAEPPTRPADRLGGERRFMRGLLTHALLQYLPNVPANQRRGTAQAFLDMRAASLPVRVRRNIANETLAVLEHAEFAALFGPASQAEVAIVAEVSHPGGNREPIRIAGQIDRLVRLGNDVLIVDYKTSPPPAPGADVPDAYLVQLAAYRLALARIYPGCAVRAAILWTESAYIQEVPAAALDAAGARLLSSPQGSP